MLPTAGEIDHVTAVFVVPVTLAENCLDCPPFNETAVGDTEICTTGAGGTRLTVAEAAFEVSATLRAVTVTVCAASTEAGAM